MPVYTEGLSELVNNWVEKNVFFPEELLELLKQKLIEKNFLAAANSLRIHRYRMIKIQEGETFPEFFIEWQIFSKGPPKARTLIYRFIRRHRLDRVQIFPPVKKVYGVSDRKNSGYSLFYLPKEFQKERREEIRHAIENAKWPFDNAKKYTRK